MSDGHLLYTAVPPVVSASNYYRQLVPLDIMLRKKLPLQQAIDRLECSISMIDRLGVVSMADIVQLFNIVSPTYINLLTEMGKQPARRSRTTEMFRWPPMVIADTDDNIFAVNPTNISFGEVGTRVNGEELADGAIVWDEDTATGAKNLLWDDRAEVNGRPNKARNINLAHNRSRVAAFKSGFELARLITVTTQRFKDYLQPIFPDKEIYVFPNSIDFAAYDNLELREHPDEVRILWQGGNSHFMDLLAIQTPMRNVMKKYPQAKLVIFGQKFKWFEENFAPEQVSYVPWVPYEAYKLRLGTLGHDINLCPLVNDDFNNSKTNIKFYESSAICRPAATLASNVPPYSDEIIDGQTALLFNNGAEFEEKLGALIEDATLRQTLASNAKDWVFSERNAEKTVPELYKKWMTTLMEYHLSHPKDETQFIYEVNTNDIVAGEGLDWGASHATSENGAEPAPVTDGTGAVIDWDKQEP